MNKRWEDQLDLGKDCLERSLLPHQFQEFSKSNIYMGGASDIKNHYFFSRWKANYHTIIYTSAGNGELITTENSYEVFTNSVTILPAGTSFCLKYSGQPWNFSWIILQDIRQWESLKATTTPISYYQNAQTLYHLLCLLYYEDSSIEKAQIFSLVNQKVNASLDIPNHDINIEHRITQFFQEVEQQLHFPWSVTSMANKVFYSPPHFHRLCMQLYQSSPMKKLTSIRMERASYLLEHTDWPIAEVANRVGYNDPFNFSKRFKKTTGLAPSDFRKQHTQK